MGVLNHHIAKSPHRQMASTDPKNIDVSLSSGVTIDWADGHHSSYALRYLRDCCPCAICTNAHGTSPPEQAKPFPMFQKVLKLEGVEPIGRYALQFQWNDGHSSGIYSFEHLREICPCQECRPAQAPRAARP
jgi:DUF971 family protein